AGGLSIAATAVALAGQAQDAAAPLKRLVSAYPEALDRIDGNTLVWRDGTQMQIDDGAGKKPFEAWLDHPDIEDMLQQPYPGAAEASRPPANFDPGRARNAAFFDKMYGDCRNGAVAKNLKPVIWLPKKAKQRLLVTSINGVDAKLAAVSAELDE